MNWKQFVNTDSVKRFKIPPGWTSREDIAAKLDCSEDQVAKRLAPALKDKTLERKPFPVWDKAGERIVHVVCYRKTEPKGSR